jgi:hypothetical protein
MLFAVSSIINIGSSDVAFLPIAAMLGYDIVNKNFPSLS